MLWEPPIQQNCATLLNWKKLESVAEKEKIFRPRLTALRCLKTQATTTEH